MAADFKQLKLKLKKVLIKLDHNYLNKVLKKPTAENLARLIFEKMKDNHLIKITIWESPNAEATYGIE
jgi:6-pyruvoyltetrahydropterin/6-carboxytetrahydropterin synthase